MLGKNFHKLLTLSIVVVCTFYLRQPYEADFLPAPQHQDSSHRNLDISADEAIRDLCSASSFVEFTSDEIEYANSCKTSLQNLRDGNQLVKIINLQSSDPDTEDDDAASASRDAAIKEYEKTFLKITIFLGFFFFMAFVCYWGFFLNFFAFGKTICFCFNYGDVSNIKIKWVYGILSLIFIISLVGVGIAGYKVSSHVQEDANKPICSLFSSFNDIVNGDLNKNWLGLISAYDKMVEVRDDFDDLKNKTSNLTSNYDTFVEDYKTINKTINDTYVLHMYDTLTRPDNQTLPVQYTPDYITVYGPQNTTNTTTYYIQVEVDTKAGNVSAQYDNILSGVSSISEQTGFRETLEDGINVTLQAQVAAQNLMTLSNTYSRDVNEATESAESTLRTIFKSLCLIPIFCLFWWLLTFILKARVFICLSIGWILLSILALTGWIISLVLIPTNITLMESCGVIDTALDDPAFFNKTINLFSNDAESVNKYLFTCVHTTDKSIISLFNLTEPLDDLKASYLDSISTYDQLSAQQQFEDQISSQGLQDQLSKYENYQNFVAVDNSVITDDLQTVNVYSSNPSSDCEPMLDTWIFNSNDCTTDSGLIFEGNDADYYNVGHQTCLGINNWVEQNGVYGNKSIQDRYAVLRYLKDCQENYDVTETNRTEGIIEGFVTNRHALATSLTTIVEEINSIKDDYVTYIDSLNTLPPVAAQMKASHTDLYQTLFNETTGLADYLKCEVIQTSLVNFSQDMCVGLIPTLFQLSLLTLLLAFFATFGACALFCLARSMKDYEGGEQIIEKKINNNAPKEKEVQMATRVY